ncbi:unnamed protein product [Ostreobium quekettii]|uniref:Uncharacterized protein n=1 Tax=Ostreobium quekettii TaxID=121088 RepID=A0A8S1J603_9CHLO|nr:unnamed protein product [Ostreobium quekettii]
MLSKHVFLCAQRLCLYFLLSLGRSPMDAFFVLIAVNQWDCCAHRMWSVWMFTIPSLRARECTSNEKDALNILFLLIPLINVTIPIVWKSFALVYSLDVATMAAVYFWKLRADPQEAD